jgi:hypothetical protein
MQKARYIFPNKTFLEFLLLACISGIVYLLFVPKFGYYYDDWYLMYSAGAKGSAVFKDIFAIDRPLRAFVMSSAYTIFGANPLYYGLGAYFFRLLGGVFFLWTIRMVWKDNHRETLWMSLIFLLYPGFLSQPNAIDYFCHLAGLAAGMLSIGLTVQAVLTSTWGRKSLFYFFSILLGWFSLGQIEWYIGLEFFRFACVLVVVLRLNESWRQTAVRFIQVSLPALLIPSIFLIWRLFYFENRRGATDVGLQLGDLRSDPIRVLIGYLSNLMNDMFDVLVNAWWLPLWRMSAGFTPSEWLAGIGIVVLSLFLFSRLGWLPGLTESGGGAGWRREFFWVGLGAVVFGLLPVILVGRSVDFKSFSRYTLIASVGAALLWPLALSYIVNIRIRNMLFGILFTVAVLTHYANGLVKARETELTRNFWWQVSWRAPGISPRATLITRYAVAAEEDYFTWGPANLIYHPESNHAEFTEPVLYAMVLNEDTVEKILAREPQEYSNRRSIRTYPNPRNILILTQPTPQSCVQVLDLTALELSSSIDERLKTIASYSEADQIDLTAPFRTPPTIPFGSEPARDWCYYYQKASYARQAGDWDAVLQLGEEAISLGYFAKDQIEWMPFLQAYALANDLPHVKEIASFMDSDLIAKNQACATLTNMTLAPENAAEIQALFCVTE